MAGACLWCYRVFSLSWDDLKIVRSAVLSGSAPSETLSWKQLLSSGQCLVYTCVNYDNMMNLRSKCLNSVVSACYSLMCWPQPHWDRGVSVTHGFVKSDPQLDQKWAKGKHRIKTCHWSGDISDPGEKNVNYFGETQLDLIFVKFWNQNQ